MPKVDMEKKLESAVENELWRALLERMVTPTACVKKRR